MPVRQWVISVPKRLRCFLADRPNAVAALTRIFIEEIERLLCTAAGPTRAGDRPSVARPRLGAVSFLHRFGSALNHHVHLHACAADGVFVPTGGGPPALLRASRPAEDTHDPPGLNNRHKPGISSEQPCGIGCRYPNWISPCMTTFLSERRSSPIL